MSHEILTTFTTALILFSATGTGMICWLFGGFFAKHMASRMDRVGIQQPWLVALITLSAKLWFRFMACVLWLSVCSVLWQILVR